jgi:hypothetical protein
VDKPEFPQDPPETIVDKVATLLAWDWEGMVQEAQRQVETHIDTPDLASAIDMLNNAMQSFLEALREGDG